MSSSKITRPSNGKPILPSAVETNTMTMKLDNGSIDSLIKGLAGVIGKKSSKCVKKDKFSLKNLSDAIITKLDEVNNDLTNVITGQLYDKIKDDIVTGQKAELDRQSATERFQKSVTEALSITVNGSALGNTYLQSIAEGVYYITDALYGKNKWNASNKIQTQTITNYNNTNSILGLMSSSASEVETVSGGGKKGSKTDVLKSAVNTFLAIVDDLNAGLKGGALKSAAKNFKPEEFVSILDSLKLFSNEIANLNITTTTGKNPLATIGEIFNSLEAVKNYDYDSMMDAIENLYDFLVGGDFSKQLKKVFEELNNINNILTSSENTPQTLYKNFSSFTESVNTLFNIFDNINLNTLLKAKIKSTLLTDSILGINALFNPIIAEVLKFDEYFNQSQKAISDFGDNSEMLSLYVFEPLTKLADRTDMKSAIKLMAYSALTGKSFKFLNRLIKNIKSVTAELNNKDVKNAKKSLKTINDLTTITNKLGEFGKTGSGLIITSIPAILGFKTAKLALNSLNGLINAINDKSFNVNKLTVKQLTEANVVITSLSKILLSGAMMAFIAIPAILGFKTAKLALNSLNGLINAANKLNTEELHFAAENIKEIGKLVLCIGGVMFLGAVVGGIVTARFKEILAFGTTFAVFTVCVIGAVNISTKGITRTLNNAKEVGTLIVMMAGLMMFAAVTGMFVLKHSPAIIGFGLTLGVFITLTVGAINFATRGAGGLRHLEKSAKAIVGIVAVSATIMLLGGAIFTTQPKLILASLTFAIMLGGFIWLLTSAISYGAKAVRHATTGLVLIMAFEIVTASVLLFPGMMIARNPWLAVACATWAGLTWGYVKAMAKVSASLTKHSKDFMQGMAGLALLGLFNTLMASSMWILVRAAEELAVAHDGTGWAGIGIILAAGGMLLAETRLVKSLEKIKKEDLIKGTTTLAGLGAVMMEVAAAMYLWTKVAKNVEDGTELLLAVGLGAGMISAETGLVWVLSNIDYKKIGVGLLVLEGLTLISMQLAGVMNVWCEVGRSINGNKEQIGYAIAICSSILAGLGGIVTLIGWLAVVGGPASAVLLASGAAIMEGLILLSWQMAGMMNAWVGVAKSAKQLDGFDMGILTDVFKTIGTSAVSLITTFKDISIFELLKVCGAASALGTAISTIASGVADAANMHYTKYENGKKIGEFNLTREDFTKAAENTKAVVSTLSKAIIEIYDENPKIFGASTDIAGLLGLQTKFGKVCKSTLLMGQVISQIADGVVHMANLSYTKYINGKSVGTFNLTAANFTAAAENTKKVIKVLGQAIIDVYNENPEMFKLKSGTLLGVLGLDAIASAFGEETPFAKACNSVALIGNLISAIADSVIKMASGDVKYYENGQEKHRNITTKDYTAAADNTDMIIKTLGQAVIDSYKKNPELFSSGTGIGDAIGFNPKFKNIIDTISALGMMIKNIADGIQTFANGAVPVYGKNGAVIDKRPIGQQDYDRASACIQSIISTLGLAIMNTYDAHKDWFSDESIGAWLTGGNPSDTPFGQTVTALSNMSKLIGEYAKQVQDFAKGYIPFYGPDGKVLRYVSMTPDTYKQAGEAIGLVISTMAESLEKTYKDHEDLFDEDNWEPMETALTALCKLIGKYANSINSVAALAIDLYDDNGKAIGKKNLTADDIKVTTENIKIIMSTMINAVWEIYNTKKSLFESVSEKSSKNWFTTIVTATSKSGKLISSLASAIKNYANMRIDKYDENGNKIGTRAFTEADFINAERHIGIILTSTTGTIDKVYKEHKDLFENAVNFSFKVQNNSNPFAIVAQAGAKAGQMISYCAKGFSDVANIKDLNNQAYIKQVQINVKNLISALAFAVQEIYTEVSKSNDNIFINANDKNSIINRIYSALTAVGKMTSDISKVYDSLSKMNTAALIKVTGVQADHSDNLIYKMIKGLAQPIIDIFNDTTTTANGASVNKLFGAGSSSDTLFIRIKNGVNQVAKIMETIQNTYEAVSKINIDITGSGTKIKDMINGLANPIIGIVNEDKSGVFGNAGSTTDKILNGVFNFANNLFGVGLINALMGREKAPDTPFGRVVSGLAAELKIIGALISVYESVSKIDVSKYPVDENRKLTIFSTLIDGLTEPIKKYGEDETTQQAIGKGIDDINDIIEYVAKIFIDEDSGVLSIYKNLAGIKLPEKIGVGGVLTQLMNGVMDAITHSGLEDGTEKIKNSLEDCFDEFDEIFNDEKEGLFSIYRNLNRLLNETGGKVGAELVQTLQDLMLGVNIIMADDFIGNILNVDTIDLYNRVGVLNATMESVYKMYTDIPQLNKDLEYFIPYLQNLQNTVGVVQNIDTFEREVNILSEFNNSINSIQRENITALQNLMVELNKFGTRFGNLDKFTEVLATKLSNCLTYLADQIRDSAKIVDKTGKLNEARKKQIQETIKQFQDLANQGINVFVQQGSTNNNLSVSDLGHTNNSSWEPAASTGDTVGARGGSNTKAKQATNRDNAAAH
jgi:hypothetical protein